MLFNIKYYFCYKIACGIAKPIAIAVGMAMIFLLKSNSSNGITSRLYSRDMGFYYPSYPARRLLVISQYILEKHGSKSSEIAFGFLDIRS